MQTRDPSPQSPSAAIWARSWQISLFTGIVTLILGIIVAAHPTGSLNVIAVLLGILLIISGLFNLIRVFDSAEPHRVWLGFAGLLFIVAGVILIRHLDLTRALIGLFIGITWIVQGVAALIAGIGGGSREGRGWWIAFGVISIIAGIVVTVTPLSSLNVLAVLLGIWFIVMGIFEIIGAFLFRHALRTEGPPAE
jgi:uncharacterized membrane protein HdeD (DUF308 family)